MALLKASFIVSFGELRLRLELINHQIRILDDENIKAITTQKLFILRTVLCDDDENHKDLFLIIHSPVFQE